MVMFYDGQQLACPTKAATDPLTIRITLGSGFDILLINTASSAGCTISNIAVSLSYYPSDNALEHSYI